MEQLITFWKNNIDFNSQCFLIEDDNNLIGKYARCFNTYYDYINSNEYGLNNPIIHSGLLPGPYAGNIRKATIYLLLLNPGFSPIDYKAEEDQDYLTEIKNQLLQVKLNKNYPFFPLNPEYSWTGAGEWWNKKLSPIINELMSKKRISYKQACSIIAKKICSFELFPYHSKNFSISNKILKVLPSVKIIVDSMQQFYNNEDKLIIIMRKSGFWYNKKKNKKNIEIIFGGKSRAASLKPYTKVIIKYLDK
jgi:hypothetical protein